MFYFITHKPIDDITNTVSSEFGKRFPPNPKASSQHKGIDFAVSEGTQVYAAHNGTVSDITPNDPYGGGKVIEVERKDESGNTYSTRYLHLSEFATIEDKVTGEIREIRKGDEIQGGQSIAISGNTGSASSGAHLHFTVRVNGKPENPRPYLANAFLNEFATTVKSGNYGMELTGDHRDNTLIANSRSNTLKGLEGSDTYSFSSISGLDVIIDSDNDGTIKIGNKVISGSIPPKTDSSGNKLDNVWTYEAFDFYRVSSVDGGVSGDGDSLVIVKSGERYSASSSNKVTIPNFPFEKDKAFGFSLGKVRDGVELVSKNYGESFNRLFFPTKDSSGVFIAGVSSNLPSLVGDFVVRFDSFGEELERFQLDEDFVSSFQGFPYEYGGRNYMLTLFTSRGEPDVLNSDRVRYKSGAALIDSDSGRLVTKGIFIDGAVDLDLRSIHGSPALLGKEEDDYFYATYIKRTNYNQNYNTHCVQKFEKATGQPVGNPVLYNWRDSSKILADYGGSRGYEIFSFTLPNEVKVTKVNSYKSLTFESPKYREYLASEISPNFNVDGGTYKTDSSLKSMVVSLSSDADADLLISPNSDSNLVIIGRDSESMLSSSLQSESQFKSRINLPILDISEADVFALDASKVSLSELVEGSLTSSNNLFEH